MRTTRTTGSFLAFVYVAGAAAVLVGGALGSLLVVLRTAAWITRRLAGAVTGRPAVRRDEPDALAHSRDLV